MKPILEVRNLWKKYKIGSKQKRYKSLRDSLISSFKITPNSETFWALQDISFDVYEGDCIGIIGRNGAGKSTLLKILSKITPPTKGYIKARGRIASLLEVGTGFHPELTGRENIYLNGSILGLRKTEIDRKFDEIVAFSGVEQFLNTPLKHYSSGMQLRLAFSVAAHLEPEILLIDEVLAVGDAEFQKKCLGKMDEVSKNGRTILFVSHNMNMVQSLCTNALLLKTGKVNLFGTIKSVIETYQTHSTQDNNTWTVNSKQYNNPYFAPLSLTLANDKFQPITGQLKYTQASSIIISSNIKMLDSSLNVGIFVYDNNYNLLFISTFNDKAYEEWIKLKIGNNVFAVQLPSHFFNEGVFFIELIANLHQREWILEPKVNAPSISISVKGNFEVSSHWKVTRPGVLSPIFDFVKLE